ncbi:MAG TPA: hypothetical protein VF594_00015, partial [Rubricoccaceae bacterium]
MEANGLGPGEGFAVDDPVLIEHAKRGVRATQFVYSAAEKPMIASTGVGRTFFRFQQWSWQSVAFQRRVWEDASMQGFMPGTEEGKRFSRMATANVLALALSAAFPASLFEATLPQPLGWATKLAEALFGEDEDIREGLFGPVGGRIQTVAQTAGLLPPVTRIPQGVLQGAALAALQLVPDEEREGFPLLMALTGGGDAMASYQMWSAMPFGLLMRDVAMVAQSPMSLVDRTTGVPLFAIQRRVTEANNLDEPNVDVFELDDVRSEIGASADTIEAYGRLRARGAAVSRAAEYSEPELVRALQAAGGRVTFTDDDFGRVSVGLYQTDDGTPTVRVTTPDLDRR